jgi:hypothetical protein
MLEEQSGPLPTLGSFSEEGKPLRLIQRSLAKDDPEPKAISCYGLHLPEIGDTWLRFVDGRPVSSITTRFLEWSLEKLEGIGKKVVVLIWDNAGWHVSKEVRRWLGSHDRRVKESGCVVRIASRLLPKQSPWLNAIEPKWVHAKRKVVVEPEGLLGAPTSFRIGHAGFSVVRITSICPFPGRSLDHALGDDMVC